MTLTHRTMQAIRESISRTRTAEVELSEAELHALLSTAEGSCYLAPECEDVDGETVELYPARWDVWGTLGGNEYRLTVTANPSYTRSRTGQAATPRGGKMKTFISPSIDEKIKVCAATKQSQTWDAGGSYTWARGMG